MRQFSGREKNVLAAVYAVVSVSHDYGILFLLKKAVQAFVSFDELHAFLSCLEAFLSLVT